MDSGVTCSLIAVLPSPEFWIFRLAIMVNQMLAVPEKREQTQKGPSRSPGLSHSGGELPSTAAAACRHHGLSDVAAEGLAELLEVLHGAVGPPFAGAVRVGLGQHPRRLLGLVLAPHLPERDEEALR